MLVSPNLPGYTLILAAKYLPMHRIFVETTKQFETRGICGVEADHITDQAKSSRESDSTDDLSAAIEKGRQAAELFDLKLREQENREREEQRTSGDTALRFPRIEEFSYDGLSRETLIRSLRDQLERLATFERVVLSSRAWRLIQRWRRAFGRQ